MTLITYGSGEVLRQIFDSLAILLNNRGGLINPLMIISVSCGTCFAVVRTLFSADAQGFLVRFLLPLIAITTIVLLPTATVHIEDVLTNRSYKVDHVPWFLARITEMINSIGYKITQGIESVMHVPNDTSYNQTGMIFGSETSLDIGKYRITNAVLEQNLKRFSEQCVFYDLALGKYSLNDLKKTTDLWNFLRENTSKVRMIPYTDPNNPKQHSQLINCVKAASQMTPLFESEKKYYAKQDIIKNLPFTFQALTKLRQEKEELIGQQLMIHVLANNFSSGSFAKSRAEAQQKSTYNIYGSLASSSLITLRAVMEALIYVSIIFILPLSVLPGGFTVLSNWIWMMLWIQLWPPFYAVLNYIMQILAQGRVESIFSGLSEAERGLSFFTSMGLMNLHEDIYAMSGYLAWSIPFLSWAFVKGGVSSLIHLAGTVTSPAQSAAASAAAEQASGNFSFANTSFGQSSYENSTGFQKNMAPSMSSGFFTDNRGNQSVIYTKDEAILKQSSSDLRWGVSSDESIISNMQSAKSQADQFTEGSHQNYLDTVSSHSRNMSDLTTHLAHSQNYSTGASERESFSIGESARYMQSQAQSFAAQHGVSEKDAMSILMGTRQLTDSVGSTAQAVPVVGSLVKGICDALPSGSYDRHASTEQMTNAALNATNSSEFQKHFQSVNEFGKTNAHSNLDDEGTRLVSGVSQSFDQVKSSQDQYQIARNYSEQVSNTASWAEQNTSSVRKLLNQDLVNWGAERCGFDETSRILTQGSNEERSSFIGGFLTEYNQGSHQQNFSDFSPSPLERYESSSVPSLNTEREMATVHKAFSDSLTRVGVNREQIEGRASELNLRGAQTHDSVNKAIHSTKNETANKQQQLSNHLSGRLDQGTLQRLYDGPRNNVGMFQPYAKDQVPLGWQLNPENGKNH